MEPATPARVRFTFIGRFNNAELLWDATLTALAYPTHDGGLPARCERRQYIEISAMTSHGRAIAIGLEIPYIDEVVIKRTIIMVRQYKRLRLGRHEFGEPFLATCSNLE